MGYNVNGAAGASNTFPAAKKVPLAVIPNSESVPWRKVPARRGGRNLLFFFVPSLRASALSAPLRYLPQTK
jgi:hypothetical protein